MSIQKTNTDLELAQKLIAEECEHIKNFLLRKNNKYGNSAIDPIQFFSSCDPTELINVRMDDKLNRILSNKDDPFSDDEDPEKDLLGYLILKRVAKNFHVSKIKYRKEESPKVKNSKTDVLKITKKV